MKKLQFFLFILFLGIFSGAILHAQVLPTPCFHVSAVKGCAPFTVHTKNCALGATGSNAPNYNYDYVNHPGFLNFIPDSTYTYTQPGTYTIRQIIGSTNNFTNLIVNVVASPTPIFSVTSCENDVVSVTITDAVYDKYAINFGDGSAVDTVLTGTTTNHTTYTVNNSYTITVTGIFSPSEACGSGTASIYAFQSLTPPDLIDLHVLKQQTILGSTQLRLNAKNNYKYCIKRNVNGGSFSTIGVFTGSGTVYSFTDVNLNTQNNIYGYQVVNFDDCGDSLASNVIYSITIQAIASNLKNTINWITAPAPGVNSYSLTKNNVQLSGNATSPTVDNTVVCGGQYCYQVIATLNNAPQLSYSIDTCITGISTAIPPGLTNINSTINGNTATISWNTPGIVGQYNISSSVNGATYTTIGTSSTNSYQQTINSNSSYCYEVNYKNLCGNTSPDSLSTCPAILTGNQTANIITLNWTNYTGYGNSGINSYVVEKLDENGTIISQTNVGTATTFNDPVNYSQLFVRYIIKVIPSNNALPSVYSNNVDFKFEAKIYAPDIFTPNADGTNDVFLLTGKYLNSFNLTVFNRWGEIVFNSNSITEGWDGNVKGIFAPEGAYTYKVLATDINNKELTQTGTVTLAR